MKIALLSQQVKHYSGGRYYAYQIAVALSELGHDVTVYANRPVPFRRDFELYRQPKIVLASLMGSDIPKHELFIGLPVLGALSACHLSMKYSVPAAVCVLDVLPLMRKYRDDGTPAMTDGFWVGMLNEIQNSRAFVFVLADWNKRPCASWINIPEARVFTVYPAVNDRAIDAVGKKDRAYRACFISRLEPHKKLPHAIDVLKPYGLHLDIVTARADMSLVELRDMTAYATFHIGVSDVEKFELLAGARLLIMPSTWEGFGMPIIEALACGTPVVCYEFPTFAEVVKDTEMARYVYFAKYNDRESLAQKLATCVKEGFCGRFDRDRRFGMNQMMGRLARTLPHFRSWTPHS